LRTAQVEARFVDEWRVAWAIILGDPFGDFTSQSPAPKTISRFQP
jgi:hypothetical protein